MLRRGVFLLAPCLVSLVACGKGGDDTAVANALGAGTTVAAGQPGPGEAQVQPTAGGPTMSYTVAGGDSLWAIATEFCTTAPAIAAANGWATIEQPIFPGDVIAVPQVQCATATSANPATTAQGQPAATTPATEPSSATPVTAGPAEIDAWLRAKDGFVPDPMYGDPADYYEDFGDVCMEAWGKTYEFEKFGLGRDDVIAAIKPLPGNAGAVVVDAIDRWAAFTATWYLRYTDVVAQYTDSNGEVDYDALVRDPDYRAFLGAYLPVAADQSAAHQYVTNLCANLLATKGSTP
ncbi:MAG: LysM peptidoglycan-binding domain-containing protein [Actinomycetota bacterium]|nr:LysM peptidoglycan-binding domain-containing protein [Actinomycetota bacterium]